MRVTVAREDRDDRDGSAEAAEEAVEKPRHQPGPDLLRRRLPAPRALHHANLLPLRVARSGTHRSVLRGRLRGIFTAELIVIDLLLFLHIKESCLSVCLSVSY